MFSFLILSVPDVRLQEEAEYSATYLMHAEHAKLATTEKKREVDGVVLQSASYAIIWCIPT